MEYAEIFGRRITLHTAEEEFTFNGRLEELEQSVPNCFFRCHKSYLVNLAMLRSYDKEAAGLKSGKQVTRSLKEQLNAIQTENFKSRELEWRRFSGFRHDIKNHLICLSGLLENGKMKQAADYMRNLTDTVKQFESPVQTGDDYADAILNVKYAEAAAAKIKITIDMAIPSAGFLDPVDLCCILGNAFDNAIAACNRLPEEERWITARGYVRQGQLVLVIKNSKPRAQSSSIETLKSRITHIENSLNKADAMNLSFNDRLAFLKRKEITGSGRSNKTILKCMPNGLE